MSRVHGLVGESGPIRRRCGTRGDATGLDAVEEVIEEGLQGAWVLENHEMVAGKDSEFALRDQPARFNCRFYRHERIMAAVQNQHRPVVGLQDSTQGALVGIVEVAGIRQAQVRTIEGPEAGQCGLH